MLKIAAQLSTFIGWYVVDLTSFNSKGVPTCFFARGISPTVEVALSFFSVLFAVNFDDETASKSVRLRELNSKVYPLIVKIPFVFAEPTIKLLFLVTVEL